MSKFEMYQLLHFAGIFTLMYSFGSLFIGKNYNKGAALAHGVGLIMILVSGFGMQARLGIGFPTWLIVKILIWILFGSFIMLAKKGLIRGLVAWIIAISLGLSAVYLAKTHPKIGFKAEVKKTR